MTTPLTDYPTARAALRGAMLAAKFTNWATEAQNTDLTDIPAPMRFPETITPANFRASVRTLDLERVLAEKIAYGVGFPNLDEVRPDPDEVIFRQAMTRFMLAGGAVADALCLHGVQDGRAEAASWRRVCPFSPWPPEAEAALKAAHEEGARFALAWLSYMASDPQNTFAGFYR